MIISTMVDVYVVYYPIILSFIWASGAFYLGGKKEIRKQLMKQKNLKN
ncbi:hypothetical protein ACGO3R_00985 [Lactococcus lactis]